MYTTKCPFCESSQVKKNGLNNGVQLYKCKSCGRQFLGSYHRLSSTQIWSNYLEGKQTILEIAQSYHVSPSTIKRLLRKITFEWKQPSLVGRSGFVHLDATYWGRNWGIILAIDEETGETLYLAFINHETTQAFVDAIIAITEAGYLVRGIIIDGKPDLFTALADHPIQMCQFHMIQIVKRYLTKTPKMNASKELLQLCRSMVYRDAADFISCYTTWKICWHDFLNKRTTHKDGKTYYLHRRIRTLVHSIDFYLPYLFTYQNPGCEGMPNTNNKIEGTFTDLKKNLNNHSGLTIEHRRLFIIAYFLMRKKVSTN